jgi:hypothetical protein
MSYTVINSQMFTAAFAGALAGMGVSGRIITDSVPGDYAGLVAVAGAFAQSFDTVWNSAAAVGTLEVSIAQEAAEGIWSGRSPNPADTNALIASTWAAEAAALKALTIQSLSDYTANSYPNPSTGGGTKSAFGFIPQQGGGMPDYANITTIPATFDSWTPGDILVIEADIVVLGGGDFFAYSCSLRPAVSLDGGLTWNWIVYDSDAGIVSVSGAAADGSMTVPVSSAVKCDTAPTVSIWGQVGGRVGENALVKCYAMKSGGSLPPTSLVAM